MSYLPLIIDENILVFLCLRSSKDDTVEEAGRVLKEDNG